MSAPPSVAADSARLRAMERLARLPAWVGVLAAALATALMVWAHPNMQIDTHVYRRGAEVLLAGTDRLYEQPYGDLPFTYPPIAAAFFLPLALPIPVAAFLLIAAGVAAIWRLTWIVLDVLRPGERGLVHAQVAAVLLPLAVLSEPLYKTFSYGQINLILAWLVAEDLLRLHRGRFGGVLLGIATLIKLTPAAFFLVVLLRKDVASMVRGVGTILAGIAVGFAVMPSSSRAFWTSMSQASDRVGDPAYFLNQSMKGVLARLGYGAGGVWLVVVLAVISVTAWTVWVALRADRDVPAVLATAVCALMISPVSWSHHWVWTWPLLVWAFAAHDARPGPRTATVAGLWALAIYTYPFWWAVPHDPDWASVPWWQMLLADTYVVLGLGTVIMFGWRAARVHRSAASRAPSAQ